MYENNLVYQTEDSLYQNDDGLPHNILISVAAGSIIISIMLLLIYKKYTYETKNKLQRQPDDIDRMMKEVKSLINKLKNLDDEISDPLSQLKNIENATGEICKDLIAIKDKITKDRVALNALLHKVKVGGEIQNLMKNTEAVVNVLEKSEFIKEQKCDAEAILKIKDSLSNRLQRIKEIEKQNKLTVLEFIKNKNYIIQQRVELAKIFRGFSVHVINDIVEHRDIDSIKQYILHGVNIKGCVLVEFSEQLKSLEDHLVKHNAITTFKQLDESIQHNLKNPTEKYILERLEYGLSALLGNMKKRKLLGATEKALKYQALTRLVESRDSQPTCDSWLQGLYTDIQNIEEIIRRDRYTKWQKGDEQLVQLDNEIVEYLWWFWKANYGSSEKISILEKEDENKSYSNLIIQLQMNAIKELPSYYKSSEPQDADKILKTLSEHFDSKIISSSDDSRLLCEYISTANASCNDNNIESHQIQLKGIRKLLEKWFNNELNVEDDICKVLERVLLISFADLLLDITTGKGKRRREIIEIPAIKQLIYQFRCSLMDCKAIATLDKYLRNYFIESCNGKNKSDDASITEKLLLDLEQDKIAQSTIKIINEFIEQFWDDKLINLRKEKDFVQQNDNRIEDVEPRNNDNNSSERTKEVCCISSQFNKHYSFFREDNNSIKLANKSFESTQDNIFFNEIPLIIKLLSHTSIEQADNNIVKIVFTHPDLADIFQVELQRLGLKSQIQSSQLVEVIANEEQTKYVISLTEDEYCALQIEEFSRLENQTSLSFINNS